MGSHQPPTNRSFYLSLAASTLRFAIIVALVIGGIVVIDQAFPALSSDDGGGGGTTPPITGGTVGGGTGETGETGATGATATGPVVRMQPDRASAVMIAVIGNRNARTTHTGAIP